MTPEQYLSKQIQLYCGEHNWLCFHTNVGKVKTADGRWFETGLPTGWPDLLIVMENGKCAFIETKIHPRKPTKEQLDTQKILRDRGFISGTVYTLEEFINIINTEKS